MKKHITFRCASLLLLAAMLTSLTACGGEETAETTAPDQTDSITTEAVDPTGVCELPDTDWEGREFRVLGYENTANPQFSNFEIWTKEEDGDVVNDAVFRRNTAVEDRYNVKIAQYMDSSDADQARSTIGHMRAMAMAGEELYDLAFCSIRSIGTAAREGLFYDLNDVEYIDFSKNWWNQNVNDTLTVNGRLFFTNSDFSLRDKNRVYLMLFNKELVNQHDLGNYYDMVRDGTWTIDKMAEGCKAVSGDTNGDGQLDYYDTFGFVMDSYNGGVALAVGGGVRIMQHQDGDIVLTANDEHTVNVIDKVMTITAAERVGSSCQDWKGKVLPISSHWLFSSNVFKEGRALFVSSFAHSLKTYSAESANDYGILPYPKYDEAQEGYHIYADSFGMLFGIPSTTPTPDFSGFMLEALSYQASTTSLPAYVEISCKTKYTYDNDSAEMLNLIFDNIVYEPAEIFGISGVQTILFDVISTGKNTFASQYAKVEEMALTDLEQMMEDIEAVE